MPGKKDEPNKLVVKGEFTGEWWCGETGHPTASCPIKLQGKPKVVQFSSESLIQADFAHEGRYKCQVRMKTGGPRLTKEATVTVIGEFNSQS